jgi:non-heme chloroperoxidase
MDRRSKSPVQTADGTRLHVKDWGNGPPLLFLHSLGVSNDIWQYQHAHFAEAGCRVVAFDRRGHGRSDQPQGGYDADTLADDLARVIAACGLEDVTLIGHSMGCLEILRYLARHGAQRVARIILVGTTTPSMLKSADNPGGVEGEIVEALRAGWKRDFPRWVVENARPFVVPETSQALLDWAVADMLRTPVKVILDCNRTVFWNDFSADCRAVAVPTLIVHGTKDASAPLDVTARRTAALIRNSRLEIYDDAPHGLMLTHMDRLHADILRFIGKG